MATGCLIGARVRRVVQSPVRTQAGVSASSHNALNRYESLKTTVLDRVSLEDVVGDHVRLQRRGRRLLGLCPFHQEKTPSFNVVPDKGFYKCFGCGEGGDVFSFVQKIEGLSFLEALKFLAERAGVPWVADAGAEQGQDRRHEVASLNDWAANWFRKVLRDGADGRAALEYVRGRGIAEATEERFQLGCAPIGCRGLEQAAKRAGFNEEQLVEADLLRRSEDGRIYPTFRNRLMFPVRDALGRVVAFGGRTLEDDPAKYLNTRQTVLFDKSRTLYGIERARKAMSDSGRALVMEGYVDVVIAHQAGHEESVATLGTALTAEQVRLLLRYAGMAVMIFDSDRAGEAAAERAIEVAVPANLTVRLARVPEGKDPADFLTGPRAGEFAAVVEESVEALEYRWDRLKTTLAGAPDQRRRLEAVDGFIALVGGAYRARAVDSIGLGLTATRLAGLLSLDPTTVFKKLVAAAQAKKTSAGSSAPGGLEMPANSATAASSVTGVSSPQLKMLEVLLAEPGLWVHCEEDFAPYLLTNKLDRAIARIVRELCEELGEFRLSDLLGRLSGPDLTDRAVDLTHRAIKRGRFEETLRDAVSKAREERREEELQSIRQSCPEIIRTAPTESEDYRLFFEQRKAHRHFAPARRRRPET